MKSLTWRANGEANSYVLLDETGNWVASILMNGEQTLEQQKQFMNNLGEHDERTIEEAGLRSNGTYIKHRGIRKDV